MDNIVGPLHSSFIPGRSTSDNAIVLQEAIFNMTQKPRRNKDVVFKLQLEKAYDQVDWRFLEDTLKRFGFPTITTKLIMSCVSSSTLSILWNGSRLPPFAPTRGLRQGDPLSPYLFVLFMERLAHLIQKHLDDGLLEQVYISSGGPPVSHLFFADDVLLFTKGKVAQIQVVHSILNDFCRASSLKINVAKSKSFVAINVSDAKKERIAAITRISFTSHIESYLGFPMPNGKGRKEMFNPLVDKVMEAPCLLEAEFSF